MNPDTPSPGSPVHLKTSNSSHYDPDTMKGIPTVKDMPTGGHMMAADDPDNPQNWPLHKKVYASAVAFAFAWLV